MKVKTKKEEEDERKRRRMMVEGRKRHLLREKGKRRRERESEATMRAGIGATMADRARREENGRERGREERVSVGVVRQNASLLYERNGPKEPIDRESASDDVVLTILSLVRSYATRTSLLARHPPAYRTTRVHRASSVGELRATSPSSSPPVRS